MRPAALSALAILLGASIAAHAEAPKPQRARAVRSRAVAAVASVCEKRQKAAGRPATELSAGVARGLKIVAEGGTAAERAELAAAVAAAASQKVERLDLPAIMGKYIGETEKNLGAVLARAEATDVVLLLDEGDALLGKRTEVKDAHDRYSDQQRSFVLERLRAHDGVVVFGHAPNIPDKDRAELPRRFHRLVKSSVRSDALWNALCAS